MNILVLCTGNSARSILLEAILNATSGGRVTAYSAGSSPTGDVHPQALSILSRAGFSTDGLRSKNWDEFAAPDAPRMAAVITVCGSAAEEPCPVWPGGPVTGHWGVEDPARVPEAAWAPAFEEAYATLAHRAKMLLDLPLETLSAEALKRELDHIGTLP